MSRTTIISSLVAAAIASLAIAPVASAKPRHPVTRAAVFASVQRQAEQSAAALEKDGNGTVTIDRSRTSVGNYLTYDSFRKSASFAIFGTKTVNGEAGTLWCLGNVELSHTKNGHTRVHQVLTCVGN